MSYKDVLDLLNPMTNPKGAQQGNGKLSFAGNGKVSVSVSTILNSERVKEQVAAVRELAKAIEVVQTSEIASGSNAKPKK